MKKIILAILCAFLLSGCTKDIASDKFTIYTSFYGMYDFARMIAGDKAEIKELIPSGVEAHDWEPGTGDMIALSTADVFIYSGMGMEPWVETVLNGINNEKLVVVEASKGIKAPGNGKVKDPHVWLDPQNALSELTNIAEGISKADPENEDYYMANLENVKKQIVGLHADFSSVTESLADKEIIVTHGAFGYLCEAYGLKQYAIEGLGGESDPSSAKIREIIDYMKNNGKDEIFYIEGEDEKVAAMLCGETGAEMYTLNPFEKGTGDMDYFDVMQENLENLKEALE